MKSIQIWLFSLSVQVERFRHRFKIFLNGTVQGLLTSDTDSVRQLDTAVRILSIILVIRNNFNDSTSKRVESSPKITQKILNKIIKFRSKKFFSVEKFFSRYGFEILIAPPCHPQNDFPYRRPCKTRFLYDKDPNYSLE